MRTQWLWRFRLRGGMILPRRNANIGSPSRWVLTFFKRERIWPLCMMRGMKPKKRNLFCARCLRQCGNTSDDRTRGPRMLLKTRLNCRSVAKVDFIVSD
ncbi:MAG: hypothetical protein PHE53_10760 [Thermoguttaceae bacterium]|nr:hypothetical protein [Thermoguttaceae bacterium]